MPQTKLSQKKEGRTMKWYLSHRADKRAVQVANRHYNRQHPDSPQFVPPGRCMVLLTEKADALWTTSWPFAAYVRHAWPGAWVCSCFRNENQYNRKNREGHLSSALITEAVAATRWYAQHVWRCEEPELGFITFVDTGKVRSAQPGACYRAAGWQEVGKTKGGLVALQLLPEAMPAPAIPNGAQLSLMDVNTIASLLPTTVPTKEQEVSA